MRAIIFSLGLCLLAMPALAQSDQPAPAPPASDSTVPAPAPGGQTIPSQTTPDQTQAAPAPAPTPAAANPPMTGPKLLVSTAMGDITIQLDSQRAPKSVANVLRYAREK